MFGDVTWNHGGTGYTRDHDAHVSVEQAKAWRNVLGSPEAAGDRLVEARLAELD